MGMENVCFGFIALLACTLIWRSLFYYTSWKYLFFKIPL